MIGKLARSIASDTTSALALTAPVAMGYVAIDRAAPETRLLGQLRGKMLPVTVAKMPFVAPGYKRA